jgi:hypothetical protein
MSTLPECWRPSAAVRGDVRVSTLKPSRMSDRTVRLILPFDLSLHPYKLQAMHALSNGVKEMLLQCRQFLGIVIENPDLPNKFLLSDEALFHLHGTVNKGLFEK